MSEAVKRISEALTAQKCEKGSSKSYMRTMPDGRTAHAEEHQHVKLLAGDVVEACDLVAEPSQIVKDLRMGSAAVPQKTVVTIQADDAFHLIEHPTI